ncbi:dUTP diphosphatase [Corynebacterium mastitidis]|uniref:Deoxyuridine 5'-triphosphate nucleotidohydrolase n=2 Tax=Corynebacterium mastitidis TaxID=161890 RepID=A0A2N0X963_9CORY|nr:dUTP diphosphatase [Corynebacterium mastitidis]
MLLSAAAHAEGVSDESPESPAGEPEPDTTPEVLPVVADDEYLPTRAHPGDAGLDLQARALVRLHPGIRTAIPTGVQVAIPEGHVGYITPRSGIAARYGLTVLNAPGTIDAGYRGEIEVLLVNHENREVWVERGDRIAQLVIHPIITPEVKLVDALPATERGKGGFGSTGQKGVGRRR